jgi:hypothetical protein
LEEADRLYRQAIAMRSDYIQVQLRYLQYGITRILSRLEEADRLYRLAIAMRSDYIQVKL